MASGETVGEKIKNLHLKDSDFWPFAFMESKADLSDINVLGFARSKVPTDRTLVVSGLKATWPVLFTPLLLFELGELQCCIIFLQHCKVLISSYFSILMNNFQGFLTYSCILKRF